MITFYIQHEYWFAVFQLVLAMLGMGATLTIRDFREVIIEPKAVISGTLIQLVLVPLVAFAFIYAFGVVGGVAVGIALIAAIPGGTLSNIFTYVARGNVALSITVTAVTTLACLVTTPVILALLISQYLPNSFAMPQAQIMREIALNLLLPLALGMAFLRYFPKAAEAFSKWCIRGSLLGVIMIVLGSLMSGRLDIQVFGMSNVLLILLLIITFTFASWLMCQVLSLNSFDTTAIDMEVVVRSINLGIMLKASLFPAVVGKPDPIGDLALLSLLLYGGAQLSIAAVLIVWRRQNNLNPQPR